VAVETEQRPGQQSGLTIPNIVRFDSLRDDWVKGADLVVRLIARSARDGVILQGFPRQWIPLFVYFGVAFSEASHPAEYVPLASEIPESELEKLSQGAQAKGALREMVEAFASLDPLIADVLYKLDRRMIAPRATGPFRIKFTGWQSYGRPEVRAFNELVESIGSASHETAVLLPCARRRPYQNSKTHRRIWKRLRAHSIEQGHVDSLVVSSIGIVPEALWGHPIVLAYDSGVPDIFRILRLMRRYFQKSRYAFVIDCLEFKPYSDCLQIVAREGLVGSTQTILCGRAKVLPSP
jgi:Domain of unknown function (DUF5591)